MRAPPLIEERRVTGNRAQQDTKFIFVTGGVASSLGKGLTAASLGQLLSARGLRVTMQKLDPYLNVDPGTMNPFEHGEVFVTEDGAETDLDLGHYERFLDRDLSGFDCRLEMGSIRIGSAKVRVGRRKRRRAFYRALEIDQCQIVLTAFTQDDSNVAQCFGIVRLQRDGVLEGIKCLARLLCLT